MINGLQTKSLDCDSTFTFFLGDVSSQNDISLTNNTDLISEFKILEKNVYSDHKPLSITLNAKPKAPLELVAECALATLKHDHYDINTKVKQTVRLSQRDIQGCIDTSGMLKPI